MSQLLLIAGALLPLISSITYAWSIIRGDTLPQVTTRFLMMAITALSFVSLLAAHDHSGVWLALTSTVQASGLWILSLKKGIGSIFNYLDLTCMALCALGIVLWLVSGQSLVGLFQVPSAQNTMFFGMDIPLL